MAFFDKTKYREPDLNEFVFGFEFEILTNSGWQTIKFGIDPIIHPELDQFDEEMMKIAHAITRVKINDK
jgi:hypothetical protein